MLAPRDFLSSFESRALQRMTLPAAASSQAGQSKPWTPESGGGDGRLSTPPALLSSHFLLLRWRGRSIEGVCLAWPGGTPKSRRRGGNGLTTSSPRGRLRFAPLFPPPTGRGGGLCTELSPQLVFHGLLCEGLWIYPLELQCLLLFFENVP
jgi:hypothetical protein